MILNVTKKKQQQKPTKIQKSAKRLKENLKKQKTRKKPT
jgi:hypothetical protein